MIEIADGKIQLCVVSQFSATDDVHLWGREESTDTLGANFIRAKGRYFFTAVLLFRARFYNLLWPTQIYILKWDSHCSGENFTKQRVNKTNKRHLDRFDGEVRSVITPVKSIRIKTP